jgi:acyl-coenzyme A synthetase/AMP-(fatty) acid ligase
MIMAPAFLDAPCVMMPRGEVTLTPALFKKITSMNKIDGIKCPPFTIAGLYEDLAAREILKSLEFVVYIGAPLDRAIGDDLYQHTRLSPVIGSTETGDQIDIRPADRKLWYTHDFVPENGHKMVPFDMENSDDLHELILQNAEDGRTNPFQLAFWNSGYRSLKRIETKELYRPIKDSDGRTRWAFSARKDDLTKLNWLAKFHAQDIESRILQHPKVQNVVVGGEARPAPYVIVQVKEGVLDEKSGAQMLDELYDSVIAGANKNDIDEIGIPRETVMTAKKEKPLKVSFKQLVQRKAVEQDYLEEIEHAYLLLERATKV